MEVIKLSEKRKVDGKEIDCCVEKITQVMEQTRDRRGEAIHMKAKGELVQVSSREVPGHIVKIEGGGTMSQNGNESRISMLKEVQEFFVSKK